MANGQVGEIGVLAQLLVFMKEITAKRKFGKEHAPIHLPQLIHVEKTAKAQTLKIVFVPVNLSAQLMETGAHGQLPHPALHNNAHVTLHNPSMEEKVNGIWTEWSSWNECKESGGRTINCRKRYGTRRKTRKCVGRENNGTILKAVLSEWSEWSFCKPDCGPNSKQTRERKCIPDVSEYKSQDLRLFTGIPKMDCKSVKAESENRPCKNPPECET
ncbi:hypothetical protein DNTS_012001 [Danionella cerebrum]|uniref:Spondin-like TSP1 domain-containing protein n=1 Tax=Danionella cerebrum TaxID=2873325 RepID=A0A553N3T2_9TELE|nr:hypothetical protein DNTS_012001 [Danionella translucida]TRY60091.1 hypothetical protein DNTS_012001 [Danionella translucida]